MATNQYFNLHGTNTPEQRLIENLNIDCINSFGNTVDKTTIQKLKHILR